MNTNILAKPESFYDEFLRKGTEETGTTHYCPGCGHGILHKMIAEAICELDCQDKTILVSPVGCSVFAYYYFDTGNIQVAHGRAPAVATGAKRSRKNSVVISYQGDGDLAAIGTAEIIHAANRGENITVFFVNNAIYGMTGGQMAPTTTIGQKTATTPFGRTVENEGYPMKMSEIIATLDAPVYVERVSIADPASRSKTRIAVKKALKNQIDCKGFSFIEVLAPCPSGLKKNPVDTMKWVKETLHQVFPVKCFKDISETAQTRCPVEKKISDSEYFSALGLATDAKSEKTKSTVDLKNFVEQKVRIAGFGGQGVLSSGVTLSVLGMNEGLNVTWIPSYGPEMRGGTSNCHVKLGTSRIGAPVVETANVLIAMNGPSLEKFEETVEPGGLIIVNSSIINEKVKRKDVKVVYAPVTDIATGLGVPAAQSVAALAVYLAYTKIIPVEKLESVLNKSLKRKDMVEKNISVIKKAAEYGSVEK